MRYRTLGRTGLEVSALGYGRRPPLHGHRWTRSYTAEPAATPAAARPAGGRGIGPRAAATRRGVPTRFDTPARVTATPSRRHPDRDLVLADRDAAAGGVVRRHRVERRVAVRSRPRSRRSRSQATSARPGSWRIIISLAGISSGGPSDELISVRSCSIRSALTPSNATTRASAIQASSDPGVRSSVLRGDGTANPAPVADRRAPTDRRDSSGDAGERTRTSTGLSPRRDLNPSRLPVPPHPRALIVGAPPAPARARAAAAPGRGLAAGRRGHDLPMAEHEQEGPERQTEQERQQYPDYAERDERADRAGLPREGEQEPDPHERGTA